MSAVLPNNAPPAMQESPGLWTLAWRRLQDDRVGMVCLAIVAAYLAMMLASWGGLVARDWNKEKGVSYANPAFLAGAENLEAREVTNKDLVTRAKRWTSPTCDRSPRATRSGRSAPRRSP